MVNDYAAMFNCSNCDNSVRIGTSEPIDRVELDGGCPGGCSNTRVIMYRSKEVTEI